MFLVDTNVLSAMRREDRAEPQFRDWVRRTPPEDMYLSVLNLYEIEIGALRIARRDAVQGRELDRWIRGLVLPVFADRILPVTPAIAMRCAALNVPDPRPTIDSLLAATALEHRLTVVTRNIADFAPMGVPILNPWQA